MMTEGLSIKMVTKSHPSKGQEFYIKAVGTDSAGNTKYAILTRCTGNYRGVEVYGGSAAEGTGIIQSKYLGTAHQQWIFIPVIQKQARILYDSSNSYSTAELKLLYSDAVKHLFKTFHADFVLTSVQHASNLNGASCPNTSLENVCSKACGTDSSCPNAHHKGSVRLLNLNLSSSYYNTTLLGHSLCNYRDGIHKFVYGTGRVANPGFVATTNSAVSDRDETVDTILHELTHNLNGIHDTCVDGERCILKGDMGYWCSACYDRVRDYLY